MPAGRPTKYDPKYCEEVIEFFNKQPFEYIQIEEEDVNGDLKKTVATNKFGEPIRVPVELPTKEMFAFSIGVHVNTLLNWAKDNEEFLCAIKSAEMLQKNILIQNGLLKGYDKTFAIFIAKNVTDLKDVKALDHISSDGSMTPRAYSPEQYKAAESSLDDDMDDLD